MTPTPADREKALEWAEKYRGFLSSGEMSIDRLAELVGVGRARERDAWLAGLVRETQQTEKSNRFAVDTPDEYRPTFFPTREMAEEFAVRIWRKEQP